MNYSDAAKEAFATARNDVVYLQAISIYEDISGTVFHLIENKEDLDLPLTEGGPLVSFRAVGLNIKIPNKSKDGLQDLDVIISNTGLEVSDALKEANKVYNSKIKLEYRIYMNSDFTKPQNDPPLELTIVKAQITSEQVSFKASFADMLNKGFLNEIYSTNRFPAL